MNIIVTTQYYENYNVGPNGFGETPNWRPKGSHEFIFPIDSDLAMYTPVEVLSNAIRNMLERQNTIAERFELVDYKLQFSQPTLVEGLEEEIKKV